MMSPGNNKYLEEVNSWMLLLFICWSGNHLSISPSLHLSISLSLSVSQLWASGDVISLAVAMFLTVFTCFRGSKHPTSASPPSLHLPPPPSTSSQRSVHSPLFWFHSLNFLFLLVGCRFSWCDGCNESSKLNSFQRCHELIHHDKSSPSSSSSSISTSSPFSFSSSSSPSPPSSSSLFSPSSSPSVIFTSLFKSSSRETRVRREASPASPLKS